MADKTSSLKLGNVFNQFTGVSPDAEQKQARNVALANTLSGVADTLSGKDYQAGMSPIEQALIAGTRGASQGFKNKAEMEKAKQQDEYNAWAKTLADTEQQNVAAMEYEQKVQDSIKQAALPTASAVIAFKNGQLDEPTYKASMKNIIGSMLRARGEELVSIEPENGDPFTFGIQARDPDTGVITTTVKSVNELVGPALEQNAEIGQAFAASVGNLPKDYFQKEKAATGKIAELQAAKDSGITFTPEEEKAYILGSKSDAKTTSDGFNPLGEKGTEALQKARAETTQNLGKFVTQQQDALRIGALLAEGVQTGIMPSLAAPAQQVFNELIGADVFSNPEKLAQIESVTGAQVGNIIKMFGSGTAISNRDAMTAERIVGGKATPAMALLKMQALSAAKAKQSEMEAAMYSDPARFGITNEADLTAKLEKLYGGPMLEKIYGEYLNKMGGGVAAAKAKSLGVQAPAGASTTPVAAPQANQMVRVSNPKTGESFMIPASDVAAAQADGFQAAQ